VAKVITLDGPAASGKSSVAQRVAEQLGIAFVSSGLLYRAATFVGLRESRIDDPTHLRSALGKHDVRLHPSPTGNVVTLDGEDITAQLATDAVDAGVSTVAAHGEIRGWVNERLKEIDGSFVIDGRDMGRDVFPDAVSKFYLTARPEVRAARRVGERAADLEAVTQAIIKRDLGDARQSVPADDAVTIDTSDLTLEEVVDRVMLEIQHRDGVMT